MPAPVVGILLAGSHTIIVNWNAVNNASGYKIELSADPAFTGSSTFDVAATETAWTINGVTAGTTWFLRVMAIGTGAHANSVFSGVKSIKTLPGGTGQAGGSIVSDLQLWLDNLQIMTQGFYGNIPQLENTVLNTTDRRRLLGSGVRRYGYIEKVYEVALEYPQFWPAFVDEVDIEKFNDLVKEIDVLRNLLIWFRFGARVVQDMLLLAGDAAFRQAGLYYTTARDSARRGVPEAMQVFEKLRLFWRRRRSRSDELTEQEELRRFKAMQRGTREGSLSIENESDQVTKGKRRVIDRTRKKQRGGFKETETERVE